MRCSVGRRPPAMAGLSYQSVRISGQCAGFVSQAGNVVLEVGPTIIRPFDAFQRQRGLAAVEQQLEENFRILGAAVENKMEIRRHADVVVLEILADLFG